MNGFYGRISHYARPARAEQQENRLTEIFAAVLERTDDLALTLARLWLSPGVSDGAGPQAASWSEALAALSDPGLELRRPVRTQRFTRSGKFVDLELRFGHLRASAADDVVVWVELKHGASPHEHQLSNYLYDLAGLGARAGAVVLLAPRGSYPFEGPESPPPEVPQRSWQHAAAGCARWARAANGVQRFLVDEFLAYLREESLMDPEVVTPVHLAAIAEYGRANESVALACDIASAYIGEHWNECLDCRKVRSGVGYWENHPHARKDLPPVDWGPAWWDWNLKQRDAEMEDSRGGVPVFIAGVCANPRNIIVSGSEGAAWEAKLHASHGFVSLRDNMQRFVRFAYPEEVLVGRTLHQQGERLGKWVVETYEALYASGPPPGMATVETAEG